MSPRIPEPMHGVNPRSLFPEWWQKFRREVYRSTYYHCAACGVWKRQALYQKILHAHEVYEIDYLLGRQYYRETVPLCVLCHDYIHRGRLDARLAAGEISHERYAATIQHGDGILLGAGYQIPEPYGGPTARWEDWRLVYDGVEYPPKPRTNSYPDTKAGG